MVNFNIDEDIRLFQHKVFMAEAFTGKDKKLENIFASKVYVMNGKEVPLDFGDKQDFFKKAAVELMAKTKRGSKDIPGNVPFTTDDIIYLIREAAQHNEFVSSSGNPATLAKNLRDAVMDILEIAARYAVAKRQMDKYKGKFAYELSKDKLSTLIDAIKQSLETLHTDIGKRFKVPMSSNRMPNEIVNMTIDYIIRNRSVSKNPKATFFDTVQKYSGNERLIWPSIDGANIVNGDNFKSFFSYLARVAKGEERSAVESIVLKYKNKNKMSITKKLLMDRQFRKNLKELNKTEGISKTHGSEMHISKLQAFAKQLLKANPEYKSRLAADGIKETAVDEIVGMISLLIKNGGMQVKF